jgi:uncharacterized small protein (DUF1192 family)
MNNYESVVTDSKFHLRRLDTALSQLVDELDMLRSAHNAVLAANNVHIKIIDDLNKTVALLSAENERLKVALQTGEQ